jgi:FHS family Na+ dependent glucose MFS transporter 1
MGLFLLHGMSFAIYDVGGNQIILRLWSGISDSPVNAMHAGFGIGAMIILNVVKPFIKFSSDIRNEQNSSSDTNNSALSPDDIKLQIPYSIAASFGFVIAICFLIGQYFETKNRKAANHGSNSEANQQTVPLKQIPLSNDERQQAPVKFIQKILFKNRIYTSLKDLALVLTLISLIFLLFLCVNGYMSVMTTYMLTYLIKGPAKFSLDQFLILQTLFWVFFIIGRFSAALLAFKLNSLVYFFCLLLSNFIVALLFIVPYFNSTKGFYWFVVCALGLTSGPLIPSCFMVANYIFKNINAFLVSLFIIGMASGGLLSLYLTGVFLDKFIPGETWFSYTNPNSSYVVPLILFSFISFCFLVFLMVVGFYKKIRSILKNE